MKNKLSILTCVLMCAIALPACSSPKEVPPVERLVSTAELALNTGVAAGKINPAAADQISTTLALISHDFVSTPEFAVLLKTARNITSQLAKSRALTPEQAFDVTAALNARQAPPLAG